MLSLLICAVLSGLLLTLSFPTCAIWPLAALAIVPFFFVLLKNKATLSTKHVFWLTLVFSATWHYSSIYWMCHVTFIGMLALATFIAFLQAISFAYAWFLIKRKYSPLFVIPMIWLAFETIVTYLMTGFPWMILGYAWRPWITIIQAVDITGVYGLSFLIVFINTAIACALICIFKDRNIKRAGLTLFFPLALLLLAFAYGKYRIIFLEKYHQPNQNITVACIQANIPSLVKHDPSQNYLTLDKYASLSKIAATQNVDIIIWSETAIPSYYYRDIHCYKYMTNLFKSVNLPIMTGLPRLEGMPRTENCRFFNSLAIFEPNGIARSTYNKMHLVPLGEYIPFEKYMPFLKLVTPIVGSLSPGDSPKLLNLYRQNISCKFGPLICFEDVFGYLSGQMALRGADILINVTNDGWFKNSSQPYQHAALAAFRAVETRRPLIRATNTGLSIIVDQYGQIVALLSKNGKKTEISGILKCEVAYGNLPQTFYSRYGNWILFLFSGIAVILALKEKFFAKN